ncbi:unnamed protein product [Paramecium octaurelia]|uniref:Transmembrane protein n=1 Tax=Paramecium octaurelia TaxID=43137 RepID=A0A8S1UVL7_PAROT|nr:unnamed protein product [Paramecium octaurelia]
MKPNQNASHKVSVHNHNQPSNPKIGKYHYAMFLSSYGSPIYLTQYKVEYISLICYWIYVAFTVAFDTFPAQNIVTDKIIFDHRVPYVIYWGPTYIYLALSVYAISTFLGSYRNWIQIFGILVYLWHLAYFVVFWAAPSVMLPKSVDNFQASCGYYWTELMLNLIMIIIQCGNTQATMNYPAYLQNYVTKVNNDIVEYLAVEDVEELNHETTPIKAQTPNQKSQIQSQKQIQG